MPNEIGLKRTNTPITTAYMTEYTPHLTAGARGRVKWSVTKPKQRMAKYKAGYCG
jgi:hypothetical protein